MNKFLRNVQINQCDYLLEPLHQKTNNAYVKTDADQLCSNCTADQRLCFSYTDNTIPQLLISKVSSVTIQTNDVRPSRKAKLLVFSCDGSLLFALCASSTLVLLCCILYDFEDRHWLPTKI